MTPVSTFAGRAVALLLALMLSGCHLDSGQRTSAEHARQVAQAREQRLSAFLSPSGFLSYRVSGRLREGRHRVGSADGSDLRLPHGPGFAGWLDVGHSDLRFIDPQGQLLGQAGALAEHRGTWRLPMGDGVLVVVRMGDYLGWRYLWPQGGDHAHFKGFSYFPVDARWRITAQWVAYPQPRPQLVNTSGGGVLELHSPGEARFVVQGRQWMLRPVMTPEQDGRMMFLFRDRSSGKESYSGGRYLFVPVPTGRTLELDFNLAVNPACVVSPHLICPVPPLDAFLDVAVLAGERDWDPLSDQG